MSESKLTPGMRVLHALAERGYVVANMISGDSMSGAEYSVADDSEIAGIIEQESGLVGLINALHRIANREPIDGFENAFKMCRIIAREALKKNRGEE